MVAWFTFVFSRLKVVLTTVRIIITAIDCVNVVDGMPNLTEMAVIVNAGLPGAQPNVLTVKVNGSSDSAINCDKSLSKMIG